MVRQKFSSVCLERTTNSHHQFDGFRARTSSTGVARTWTTRVQLSALESEARGWHSSLGALPLRLACINLSASTRHSVHLLLWCWCGQMPNSPPPPRTHPPSPPPPRFRIHHNHPPSPPPSRSRINLLFCAPFCAPCPPLSSCSLPSLVAAFPALALAL